MLLDLPIPRSVRRLIISFVVCVILTQFHFSCKYGYSCWTIDRNWTWRLQRIGSNWFQSRKLLFTKAFLDETLVSIGSARTTRGNRPLGFLPCFRQVFLYHWYTFLFHILSPLMLDLGQSISIDGGVWFDWVEISLWLNISQDQWLYLVLQEIIVIKTPTLVAFARKTGNRTLDRTKVG